MKMIAGLLAGLLAVCILAKNPVLTGKKFDSMVAVHINENAIIYMLAAMIALTSCYQIQGGDLDG